MANADEVVDTASSVEPATEKQKPVDAGKPNSSGPVRAAVHRETPRERRRRDPLRKELARLIDRRDELTRELDQVADAIAVAKLRLEPLPGETRRDCFGKFDASDYDCRSLCPFRPECEVTSEEARQALRSAV